MFPKILPNKLPALLGLPQDADAVKTFVQNTLQLSGAQTHNVNAGKPVRQDRKIVNACSMADILIQQDNIMIVLYSINRTLMMNFFVEFYFRKSNAR